nr:AbrB/MazE/SpoVT family DNA-binding domain-containing protein [Enterococcus alishanensis]
MEKKYKIRKSGNSDVTTIPKEVKEHIGVNTGDSISYLLKEDGSIVITKAVEEVDIDQIVISVMAEYDEAIKDLVDL